MCLLVWDLATYTITAAVVTNLHFLTYTSSPQLKMELSSSSSSSPKPQNAIPPTPLQILSNKLKISTGQESMHEQKNRNFCQKCRQ